jgi:hypothetical protein
MLVDITSHKGAQRHHLQTLETGFDAVNNGNEKSPLKFPARKDFLPPRWAGIF